MRTTGANRSMGSLSTCIALVLVASLTVTTAATPAIDDKAERERVTAAAQVLREMTRAADVPDRLLERARGIAVVPHVVRGAFILGGRWGKGVVAARNARGKWGPASFVDLSGASIGLQIGGDATDLIMVFIEEDGLKELLDDKVELGANVSVAAGPIGRSAEAGTNLTLDSAIYAYSRSKGVFAGAALDGVVLTIDDSANEKAFGREIEGDVAMSGSVKTPAIFAPFTATVAKATPQVAR